METDNIIKDTLHELYSLKTTAIHLLKDYNYRHDLTSDEHYAIQLKAQYKYKSYKLTHYIMETYNFGYVSASNYVSWYIKNYNIKNS